MASEVPVIDAKLFQERLAALYSAWSGGLHKLKLWGGDGEKGVDAFYLVRGKDDEDAAAYERSLSIVVWLFGFEMSDLLLVFKKNKLSICASSKKVRVLSTVNKLQHKVEVEFIVRDKANHEANYKQLLDGISQGARLGTSLKEKPKGPFAEQFLAAAKAKAGNISDVASGLAHVLQVKTAVELQATKKAAEYSTAVFRKYLLPEVETIIDEEKKVSHEKLSQLAEDTTFKPKAVKSSLDEKDVDVCYAPIIQSGSTFNLKPSAQCDTKPLSTSDGSVILSLGARYQSYCSNLARTYFINPTKEHHVVYGVLEQVFRACKLALKAGNKVSDVWKAAMKAIESSKRPDLKSKFTPNCGWGTGLEYRDSTLSIKETNHRPLKSNMVFILNIGFGPLQTEKKQTFACLLSDTLQVTADEPIMLTRAPRQYKEIIYSIGDDQEDDDEEEEEDDAMDIDITAPRRTRQRAQAVKQDDEDDRAYQIELEKIKMEQAIRRLKKKGDNDDDEDDEEEEAQFFQSYESPAQFPTKASPHQIYVDQRSESILVPMFGKLVPFHISTIKSVNKADMGDFTDLRINFLTPDGAFFNRSASIPGIADPKQQFIQELSYRATNGNTHLSRVYVAMNNLKKLVSMRAKEQEQKSTLVEQDSLIIRPRNQMGKQHRIRDVTIKPLLEKRKTTGIVEVHINGIRFISTKGTRLDIIFKNIKHAIFQPAAKDSVSCIIHLQFHNEIMVGRKKSQYVQFYYEVVDVSQDLDSRTFHGERQALQEEQMEKQNRRMWNTRFRNFVGAMETAATERNLKLNFDVPYKDLAFTGVPDRETVKVIPTVNCLVSLDDTDPLCLSLDEVDIVSFERVRFGLKSFDMVFVPKDLNKPFASITSIPMKELEDIKKWLRSIRILYYESKTNLVWKNIVKEVMRDPLNFWEEGGWKIFLAGDDDDEEDEGDGEESEFEPESEEYEDDESDEYESENDTSESEEEMSEVESGEDWDELEEDAARDDRQKWGAGERQAKRQRRR